MSTLLVVAHVAHNMCESCRYFHPCVTTCAPPLSTPLKPLPTLRWGEGRKWSSCEHVLANYTGHYVEARSKWERYYPRTVEAAAPELHKLLEEAASRRPPPSLPPHLPALPPLLLASEPLHQDHHLHVGIPRAAASCRPGARKCGGFPRLVHQTWKSKELPPLLVQWRRTWQEQNPGYEVWLWSDADNERFLSQHYPWFMRYYRAYDSNIKRADAVRVFYLYHYGGIYADLDFACVRPFDALLLSHASAEVLVGRLRSGRAASQSIPNALMVSKPRADFWLHAMHELVRRVNCDDPMFDTGPTMLTHAVHVHGSAYGVDVLNQSYFYRISWNTNEWTKVGRAERLDISAMSAAFAAAAASDEHTYALTAWMHSWGYVGGLPQALQTTPGTSK